MKKNGLIKYFLIFAFSFIFPAISLSASNSVKIEGTVGEVIHPLIEKYALPGVAVGIILNGETYIYNFGVKSKKTGQLVDNDTLFELGSISKTMTATLAAYAKVKGKLSFDDKVSKFIPALKNSDFSGVSLLNLGTHTHGGLPLQVPDKITNVDALIQHYKTWKAQYPIGTQRTYSNVSIGLLGYITAKSLGEDFEVLMKKNIFSKIGIQNTYLTVPQNQMKNYAQGYTEQNVPKRISAAVFDKEAYGVRSTASDVLRFLQANMQLIEVESDLSKALIETHRSYYQVEQMTQDLIWEQFQYPVSLADLLLGNSKNAKAFTSVKIEPARESMENVWINKTGSTSGFAGYVAFVPAKKTGIVLLANKAYPISARVTAAYQIITKLM